LHASQVNVHGLVLRLHVPAPSHRSSPLHHWPSVHEVPEAENVHTSVTSLQPVTQAVAGQRAPAPTQVPAALQVSVSVQNWPSLHAVPDGLGDQAVWLTAGWHDWHALAGLVAPVAKQAPAIRQPADTSHRSVVSLHVSQDKVHGLEPGRHTPVALHVSGPLHQRPSVQDVPSGSAGLLHAPVTALQMSVVQGRPSLQSAAV